ncbi:MAG TPA: cyclic nucleotide-binding domain-containing protein [Zoogloea sp.]|uniref:cyclic nucleotide-binding domain-containing protein n=1 Tax=Zoogloea sp. TaxID=49181 RepID=UPI002C2F5316|nr:cyclic nucleotide-binding domain-containing protein [Zoogloea sp.]HMV16827.1 cyclic nucleotide-binding domain-containing protein [Rhodocyclaceae bacterium]HMV62733.1 cyclic nucleotide-binding domain-containing protein [Rhodocyclaceae bacterium]HMW51096.1 cyclic nucleotide-binding domain-containing protein [Rhodocyclaceae bacterium]HMY49245.1 cyclic nucleotide-binding domain-containing protein [Rhodocyclaceae bacterium]HMZ75157.1 cyclic nucleotide-binding domain-containing protein [Rhodocycl
MPLTAARIAQLQGMPLFGGLTPRTLEVLLRASRIVDAQAGHVFCEEHAPGDTFFILEAGQVEVSKGGPRGRRVLRQLSAGDCFGEMALMDLSPRSATVRALCASRALEIPAEALQALYECDVEQFALLMMNMGREVSRRLRSAGTLE